MKQIQLKYGKSNLAFDFDESRFQILGEQKDFSALSDIEVGAAFDSPIDSLLIEEIIKAGETVLIVVPDATRRVASGQIVNLLVRRLIANGTMPFDVAAIFATGIHRNVTEAERLEILTPFIAQRVKTFNHDARNLMGFVRLGETSDGIPIELNRHLTEFDHTIIVGGVSFHYFAGFSGGRKMMCPGLASSRTISATHKLAFDCETLNRRDGVDTGILEGNTVHEACVSIVEQLPPSFSINTITNGLGEAVKIFAGDWQTAHKRACEFYASEYTIEVAEKRDVVIASCGGFPNDINMIQAHKTLDAAARVCKTGGTIILLAECADGLGRNGFLNWFEAENSRELAEKLCESYQVNGQTAWNLLRIAEEFDVKIITSLDETKTRPMRLHKARSLDESSFDKLFDGYILPFGAKFNPQVIYHSS